MRVIRFLISLFLACGLGAVSSQAQAPRTQTSQSPAMSQPPSQSSSQQQTPGATQSPSSGPTTAQQPAPAQAGPESKPFRVILVPGKKDNFARRPLPDGPLDPGIFLPTYANLGRMCGSIVSYNFSQGENPRLESVTTCTPGNAQRTLRVDRKEKQPPAPQLRKTDFAP